MEVKHKWKFKAGKAVLSEVFPDRSRVVPSTDSLGREKPFYSVSHHPSLHIYSFPFLPLWVMYFTGFMSLIYIHVFVIECFI